MEKIKAASDPGQPLRAVVFDLDGTLVDSLEDIAYAVNSTLEAHGRRGHPLASFKTMVGWGLRRLLETASVDQPFEPQDRESVYEELLAAYRARPVVHTKPYEGIPALLESLSGRVPLGVLSNKEDGMTKTIIDRLFPRVEFQAVWGSRPGKPNKPDPSLLWEMLESWGVSKAQCAYLGDSDVDMETARRAEVVACGASWGFRGEAELRTAGAQQVFDHPQAFGYWLDARVASTRLGNR